MTSNTILDLIPGLGEKTLVPLFNRNLFMGAGLTVGLMSLTEGDDEDLEPTYQIQASGAVAGWLVRVENNHYSDQPHYYVVAIGEATIADGTFSVQPK